MNPYLNNYMAKAHTEQLRRQADCQRGPLQASNHPGRLAAGIAAHIAGSRRTATRKACNPLANEDIQPS
jgi:hypothetical protein